MSPKFGTSGLRGLVTELTDTLIADHIAAFAAACPVGSGLYLGRDLRASSPDIAAQVARSARAVGLNVTDCGAVPTPALALAALQAGACAVMVTGSHIPADRNGLKFYTPTGEITKADEAALLAQLGKEWPAGTAQLVPNTSCVAAYLDRYLTAYGPTALQGQHIGVYSHSAVGRDLLLEMVTVLGGRATELGRSTRFVPVDTEAVDPVTKAQLTAWAQEHQLTAIISTDGDGDRPLVADGAGQLVPGDILGQITARALGAEIIITPVSSNSGAEAGGRVIRTKIGSPYVIAAMEANPGKTVGYEANGGFLLGFDARGPAGPLPALMTRDALLPIIAPLTLAKGNLASLVAREPARFTATGRLQEVNTAASAAFLNGLLTQPATCAAFLAKLSEEEVGRDTTDGLRLALRSARFIHLRPSGNAPEFRFYAEAETPSAAAELLKQGLALLKHAL